MSPFAHVSPSACVQRYESRATNEVTPRVLAFTLPQLAQVADVAAATWLPDALSELRSLRRAGVNIPGLGDFTLNDDTVDRARQLLTLECITRLSEPTIVPFSGGGIAINWSRNGRELLLSVFSDGEVTYERTNAAHAVVDENTLADDKDLDRVAGQFMASLG